MAHDGENTVIDSVGYLAGLDQFGMLYIAPREETANPP